MKNELTAKHITLAPHVIQLLIYLQKQNYATGLLTGNFESVAGTKLKAANIDKYFQFGAFGGSVNHRNKLPTIAKRAAERHLGKTIKPENMIIIGDTPEDILCAQNYGAKSVAVTTGSYNRKELGPVNTTFAGCAGGHFSLDKAPRAPCGSVTSVSGNAVLRQNGSVPSGCA